MDFMHIGHILNTKHNINTLEKNHRQPRNSAERKLVERYYLLKEQAIKQEERRQNGIVHLASYRNFSNNNGISRMGREIYAKNA